MFVQHTPFPSPSLLVLGDVVHFFYGKRQNLASHRIKTRN